MFDCSSDFSMRLASRQYQGDARQQDVALTRARLALAFHYMLIHPCGADITLSERESASEARQ